MRFALAHVRPPGLLTALALAAALGGCSLAPRYERPASPVAAAYPTGEAYGPAASDASPAAADIGWRDFFRDPLLRQLIEVALHNNRDLRQAALKVEAAQALYRIQRAELAPSLALAGQASVERLPADLRAAREAGIERRYEVGGAAATWELDLWGRIRSLNDQALAAYLALAETRHAAQMSLVSEVATVYLALRADQELLGLADATLEAQRRSYELTGHLLGAGHATRLDLRLAETALRDAEASRAASLRQAARRRNALVLLLGQALTPEQSRRLDAAAVLSDDVIPGDLPGGLPSDLLARRPDIRAAEQVLRGANAHIGAARAAFFPAIHLTASAGTASASLGELFEAGSGAWRFAPRMSLPVFQGGALRAALDAAHVQKRIEIARYEQAVQAAFRDVADGLAGKRTLDEQIRAERLSVAASRDARALAAMRFELGQDGYLAVLEAHRDLYATQRSLVATRLARLNNLIGLYKALGGGWSTPPRDG